MDLISFIKCHFVQSVNMTRNYIMDYAILLQIKMLYNNFNYRDRASNLNLKHV